MIIPDINLLLYAHDADSRHHRVAATWWQNCMNGTEPVGFPRVVLFGFLRLATSSRVYLSPMTVEAAAECITTWTERPHVVELDGGPNHLAHVVDLIQRAGTAGNLVTDAQIAAIAIEQKATVFTNDSDFSRFPGLKRENPLER